VGALKVFRSTFCSGLSKITGPHFFEFGPRFFKNMFTREIYVHSVYRLDFRRIARGIPRTAYRLVYLFNLPFP